jgi:nucleoside-diphosphate-sugar epimerase
VSVRTTVLITGGAGNLGRHTARKLSARGYRPRIFDLPDLDYGFAEGRSDVEVVTGDLCDPKVVQGVCRGVAWVVHLAAIMPPLSETDRDLAHSVNVEGTRSLLSVMPPEVPLVFASSVATYGVALTDVVTIDHPQHPIDFYGETKKQNEQDILDSGRPCVLLRLSGISVPALLELPRPWFFSRDQKMEFIHLDDAATAVSNCVGNEHTLGEVWQIAGGETWRMFGQDYSDAICQTFSLPLDSASFLEHPNWPAWLDTSRSQRLLDYQYHTFEQFVEELRRLYLEAIRET